MHNLRHSIFITQGLSVVSFITLVLCLLLGIVLQQVKTLPKNAHLTLGTLILYVPLPAICFLSLPDLKWNFDLLPLGLTAWIGIFSTFFMVRFLGKKFGWSRELQGCLILCAGFGNTSFVGFPVIEALFGKEALKHAIFLDQAGNFLGVSSIGVWFAVSHSSGKLPAAELIKRILSFPPFLAFVGGILLGTMGIRPEGVVRDVLQNLAVLLTPMALICVGLQLKWSGLKEEGRYLALGLTQKLILFPLIIFVSYSFLDLSPIAYKVSVIESGMAPMVTACILASIHGLRPGLAGLMIGLGVPLSFLTTGLWYWLLNL